MALKSYRLKLRKKKKRKMKPMKDMITGGVTAMIGISFLSQTAGIIKKL